MSNLSFFDPSDTAPSTLQLPPSLLVQALNLMQEGVILTDRSGQILYANRAAGQLLHRSPEQLQTVPLSDYLLGLDRRDLIQQFYGAGWRGELRCRRAEGAEFPLEVGVRVMEGESILIWSLRDRTAQRQLEQELIAENQELDRSNRMKSEFLANMSHELRTPLTSILGFSSILKQKIFGDLTPKQELYIQQIHRSGQHLLALINDILDLSKIEAGKLLLDRQPLSMAELCQETIDLVSEQARSRNLTIQQKLAENLPPLMADEVRMRQMLLNLLSNAIKFSYDGGTIGLEVEPQDGMMAITVWDEGVGIPPEKQHLLFSPFQQVDEVADRRRLGTGLGLALTRRLAELHAGRIEFVSQPGKGSHFTIALPMLPIPETPARES